MLVTVGFILIWPREGRTCWLQAGTNCVKTTPDWFFSCFHPSDSQGGAKLLVVSEIPSLVPRALHGNCTPAIPNYLFLGTALSSCKLKTDRSEDCACVNLNKHMEKKRLNTKTKISFNAAAPRMAAWDWHSLAEGLFMLAPLCAPSIISPAIATQHPLRQLSWEGPNGPASNAAKAGSLLGPAPGQHITPELRDM